MEESVNIENENKGIMGLSEYQANSKSDVKVFTTLTDKKKIFNLGLNCNHKLNDCEGEQIRVKDMLCRVIKKKLDEPIINEETGEVKEYENKLITILIDDKGESYVTKSKSFFYSFMNYCNMFPNAIKDGECEIIIKKVDKKNSNFKSLGFELI